VRRDVYCQWLRRGQWFVLSGLVAALLWNATALWLALAWWPAFLLPLFGALLLGGVYLAPYWLRRRRVLPSRSYRLRYDAPTGWSDQGARRALLTWLRAGHALTLAWARDGEALGCWLLVPETSGRILARLVPDLFPAGTVESVPLPGLTSGCLMLRIEGGLPHPVTLAQLNGVVGVAYRWLSPDQASVAVWGTEAMPVAAQFSQTGEILAASEDELFNPLFTGDNPWPELPTFPASAGQTGLTAVSRLSRLASALRVDDAPALFIGTDSEGHRLGFALPELAGLRSLRIVGQAAERLTVRLVEQAIGAGQPVLLFDGKGVVTAGLTRRLPRAVATAQIRLCDVERPAQSRFRLNPLWLPSDPTHWPAIMSGWALWLREVGVTPAGLGQAAYRHTQLAVTLTALAAAERGLAVDIPTLAEALETPDFLTALPENLLDQHSILSDEVRHWWQTQGRQTSGLDVQMRLAHLRERLQALLALPEYRVLWQAPYLDPISVAEGSCLFWRIPDRRHRLQPFLTAQLLATSSLLTVWPEPSQPLLIVLHEVTVPPAWLSHLHTFPAARLIVSSEASEASDTARPTPLPSSAYLLSRLDPASAARLANEVPDIPASDLTRLPLDRAVLKVGEQVATVEIEKGNASRG